MNMTIAELISKFRENLIVLYDGGELDQVIFLAFEGVLGYSKTDLVLKAKDKLSVRDSMQMNEILGKLQQGVPVQYALGFAWFDGMRFRVTPDVLIPRQETEELIHWIVDSFSLQQKLAPLNVLDIGTGSGCIAIRLKKRNHPWHVAAIDVSQAALDIAKENAAENKADVEWIEADILSKEASGMAQLNGSYHLIVSNPPYVRKSEKAQMHKRVYEQEPHLALFVPDEDPLIYYRAIATFAAEHLAKDGWIYFEINEALGEEVCRLLKDLGFHDVECKKDIQGKDRMCRAKK